MVSVVLSSATAASPKPMMQFQLLINQITNVTSLGARKEAVYPFSDPACPLALVIQKLAKHSPPAIRDGLSQMMVFDHSGYIQVFNLDVSKLINNPAAGLVQKVFALVANLFVLAGNGKPGLFFALASLLATAQSALQSFKSAFGFSEVSRAVNLFASRQYGEMLKPQVNADYSRFWRGVLDFDFALNRDEVSTALGFRYGTVFHLAFNGTMKHDADFADFRKVHSTFVNLKTLRIADRLLIGFAFKLGILSPTRKEVLIGSVEVL